MKRHAVRRVGVGGVVQLFVISIFLVVFKSNLNHSREKFNYMSLKFGFEILKNTSYKESLHT